MRDKWSKHDDRQMLTLSPVPITIICSKFDQYVNTVSGMDKKEMTFALRHIAHSNGCDIVFASVKSMLEKTPGQLYRHLLMSHMFDTPVERAMDANSNNPIYIRAGQDHLSKID